MHQRWYKALHNRRWLRLLYSKSQRNQRRKDYQGGGFNQSSGRGSEQDRVTADPQKKKKLLSALGCVHGWKASRFTPAHICRPITFLMLSSCFAKRATLITHVRPTFWFIFCSYCHFLSSLVQVFCSMTKQNIHTHTHTNQNKIPEACPRLLATKRPPRASQILGSSLQHLNPCEVHSFLRNTQCFLGLLELWEVKARRLRRMEAVSIYSQNPCRRLPAIDLTQFLEL